jgi:hypothetical protein
MPLNSASISQNETERRAQELLHEFYGRFFTGVVVQVAGESVTLPVCEYFYAVQSVPKASDKPQIHTVFFDWKPISQFSGSGKLVRAEVTAQVIVRAGQPGVSGQNPDHAVRRVSDAVRQLFESEQVVLAQKGIHHCAVKRGPVTLPMAGMAARLMVVTMQFHYLAAA